MCMSLEVVSEGGRGREEEEKRRQEGGRREGGRRWEVKEVSTLVNA